MASTPAAAPGPAGGLGQAPPRYRWGGVRETCQPASLVGVSSGGSCWREVMGEEASMPPMGLWLLDHSFARAMSDPVGRGSEVAGSPVVGIP